MMMCHFRPAHSETTDDGLSKGLSDTCPHGDWFCRAPRAGVGQATKEETAGGNVMFR